MSYSFNHKKGRDHMQLMATQHYGGNDFSFYSAKRKDIFMTINELAVGFGYASKSGIEKLIQRNPHLLEKEYSSITTVPIPISFTDALGGARKQKTQLREIRVFTKRGIFEIGCISRTKVAKAFRTWVYKYIEKLENALIKDIVTHNESKDLQKMLHDAVYESPAHKEKAEDKKRLAITNFNKLLIKTASQSRVKHKEDMTAEEIQKLEYLEHKTIALLHEGKNYQEIRSVLLND